MNPNQPVVALDERRDYARHPSELHVYLLSLQGYEVVRCRMHDLSEAGVFVSAPIGYGLAVGQRFEILLGEPGQNEVNPRLMGRGHLGTVVRTRMDLGTDGDWVGVALQFDQPIGSC